MNEFVRKTEVINKLVALTSYKTKLEITEVIEADLSRMDKWLGGVEDCLNAIEAVQPVDAVPVAYCQFKKNASGVNRYCTKCGAYLEDREYENHTIKFCYYCGSRVVLEKGERNDDQ